MYIIIINKTLNQIIESTEYSSMNVLLKQDDTPLLPHSQHRAVSHLHRPLIVYSKSGKVPRPAATGGHTNQHPRHMEVVHLAQVQFVVHLRVVDLEKVDVPQPFAKHHLLLGRQHLHNMIHSASLLQ